jgi:hypothetical protein
VWVWLIALYGLASNAKLTAGTIALLVRPLTLEVMVRGKIFHYLVSAILLTTWAIVSEGELCAMAWLPAMMVLTWTHYNGPVQLPQQNM